MPTPDLTITNITVSPTPITAGATFTVTITTFACPEDFNEGGAYELFLFVTSLTTGMPIPGQPANPVASGHLQDTRPGAVVGAPWLTPTNVFRFTLTAGTVCPDTYLVTAVLLDGPTGLGGISSMSITVPVVCAVPVTPPCPTCSTPAITTM
jgi:hypothetical protein